MKSAFHCLILALIVSSCSQNKGGSNTRPAQKINDAAAVTPPPEADTFVAPAGAPRGTWVAEG